MIPSISYGGVLLINNEGKTSTSYYLWGYNENISIHENDTDNTEFKAPRKDNHNDDGDDYDHDDNNDKDENNSDNVTLPTNMQEDVIAKDAIYTTISNI